MTELLVKELDSVYEVAKPRIESVHKIIAPSKDSVMEQAAEVITKRTEKVSKFVAESRPVLSRWEQKRIDRKTPSPPRSSSFSLFPSFPSFPMLTPSTLLLGSTSSSPRVKVKSARKSLKFGTKRKKTSSAFPSPDDIDSESTLKERKVVFIKSLVEPRGSGFAFNSVNELHSLSKAE